MRHESHRGRKIAHVGSLLAGLLFLPTIASAQTPPLQERLQLCAGCHNPDGNAAVPENPKLSGLDPDYIARQLADFKSGKRPSPIMSTIIPMVDEKEFAALAHFYAGQKRSFGAPTPPDPKLLAQGKEIFDEGILASAVPACSGCHNEDGSGSDKYPRVNGQNAAYVVQQMLNFKNGTRTNDSKAAMQAVAKRMNEKEIRAVAEYITTLKGE